MRGWRLCVALVLVLPLPACEYLSPAAPNAGPPKAATPPPATAAAKAPAPGSPAKAAADAKAASTPAAPPPPPPDAYAYQTAGRRDPFINVLRTGAPVDPRDTAKRGEGAAGLVVDEIVVRGIVQINGRLVAMVQGPSGRSYNIHQGDKLADGVVKSITREGLVIAQDVNDPLSTAKQREVRKLLRSLEEAKR